MGFFKRLFGKSDAPDSGNRFIMFSAPSDRPKLSPELARYVKELEAAYRQRNAFDREAARAIGRRIEEAHGYNGMVAVCDTLRFTIGAAAARTLEYYWDGIGEWQS